MAWNPKTVAGKLLKGAITTGGSVLGLVTGTNLVGAAARVVGNVVSKGTKVLTKSAGVLSNIRTTSDKVADSAKNLVDGYTTEVRNTTNAAKEQLRKEVATAIGEHTVMNAEGIETTVKKQALTDFLKSDGVKYAAIGLAALFILPKILKK